MQVKRTLLILSVLASTQSGLATQTCNSALLNATAIRSFHETAQINEGSPYEAVLSKDMDVLATQRFTSGPGPQGNMTRENSMNQFFFNENSGRILEIKKRLLQLPARQKSMIQVEAGQEVKVLSAVREQFAHILIELPQAHSDKFRVEKETLTNLISGAKISKSAFNKIRDPRIALLKLGEFVTEDLFFLTKKADSDDFVVIGGLAAIPSQISVSSILGQGIVWIHSQVSNPEKSKAFAQMINSALGRLKLTPQMIVKRNNLLIEDNPTLSLPNTRRSTYEVVDQITDENYQSQMFIRTERQSLRGLVESDVVVFSILPMVYSIGQVMTSPEIAQNVVQGLENKYLQGPEPDSMALEVVTRMKRDLQKLTP